MTSFFNPASGEPTRQRAQHNPRHQSPSAAAGPDYYNSSDWWQLRAAIMKALYDFPEARDSVVRALRDLHALQEPDAPTP